MGISKTNQRSRVRHLPHRPKLLATLLAAMGMGFGGFAYALPAGGQVAAGTVTIASPSANTLVVNQNSAQAIVNWQSFGIASGETTRFNQPSSSSVILNRVLGTDVSGIYGSLQANGKVFLINPNGVLFAPGARVDVGGLVASSLNLTDQNFLNRNYIFSNEGNAGSVINQGDINAAGGYVALIAPQISNSGNINANGGSIGLAAGDKVNLDFDQDGMLSFKVDLPAAAARIDNTGSIVADGGVVVMTASAKDALLSTVINNEGVVRARGITQRNGVIILDGGDSGVVSVSGTLDVSNNLPSPASGGGAGGEGVGGTIKVLGDKVSLFAGANIDASGSNGGGTVLVGGNFQGKGPEHHASTTSVSAGAVINADATDSGNGGKIAVWSDGNTFVAGALSARGGASSGNGGFIETSAAHVNIADTVRITTAALNGKSGLWLIDPVDYTIAASGGNMTGAALTASLIGGNVSILSSNGTVGTAGDVNVNDVVAWSANLLTLNAQNNININANLNGSGTASLALEYGQGAVALNNTSNIITRGAVVNLPAGTTNFTTLQGSNGVVKNYTVITSLGAAGSITTTDLQGMSGNSALNYALGGDINAAATSGWNAGAGFLPVFDYSGTFDGLGHTVSNLTISRSGTDYVGLFRYGNPGSVIQNVGLLNGSVSGHSAVGGLVGATVGTVSNSYFTGSVTGGANGNSVGGLMGGLAIGGTVSNSYATGSVSAGAVNINVGGLIGSNSGTVSNSYATNSVSGASTGVGGLVGLSDATGNISTSYATGSVSGTAGTVGGLVGSSAGTVSNSFWDTVTSGQGAVGVGSNTGTLTNVVGMTTTQMMQLASFTGWDIANTGGSTAVWRIYNGMTAPLLRSFLTPITLTPVYNGTVQTLTNVSDYTASIGSPVTANLINTEAGLTLNSSAAAGTHTAALNGFSSIQQGYDISYATSTIAGTGSTANNIIIANALTWSGTGNFTVSAIGDIAVNAALTGASGNISLNAGGTITQTGIIGTGVAGTMDVNASTGINLGGANAVRRVYLNNDTSGNIVYNSNVGGANTLTVDGVNTGVAGGSFTVTEATGDLTVSATNITTKGGDVALTTQKANGLLTLNGTASNIDTTTGAQATGGNVTLTADHMTLGGVANNIKGGTGGSKNVTLQAYTVANNVAVQIGAGAADAPAVLGLTAAELQGVSTDLLQVSTVGTGAMTVTGALDLSASLTGSKVLSITSGGAITGTGNLITATGLAFFAANGAVGLTTAVSNLAGSAMAGGLTVSNTMGTGLNVTDVNGELGLVSINGTLSLTETTGNLTALSLIQSSASTAAITLNGANKLLTNGAVAITGTAGVTLTADEMALTGGTVNAGAAVATLAQKTSGQLINLGTGADANGTLGLTAAELDTVTAGILRIGNTNSGAMTISAAINPANAATLHLTGAGVTGNTFTITDTSLALTATGTGNIDVGTAVNNLAAFSNNGTITVSNTTACCLTITTVDTVAGIDASTGNKAVSLTETLGIVTLSNAVTAGTGTVGITLNTLDKLLTQNANITGQGITLTADNMMLASTITGQAGLVTLASKTAGTAINVGGAGANNTDAAGHMDITQGEIDTITTSGGITIGATNNTGGITVVAGGANLNATGGTISGNSKLQTGGGNITINNALSAPTALTLDTRGGGAVTGGVNGTGALTVGAAGAGVLNANASTGINLSNVGNNVHTAHLNNNTSGAINYNSNVGGANILTVDGVNTGTAAGGSFTVTEAAGDLTVSATNITTKGGDVALTTQKANGLLTLNGTASNIDTTTGAQATGGYITLTADNMTLGGIANNIKGGTGGGKNVTLQAYTAGNNVAVQIGAGATDAPAVLGLTQAELQGVSTDHLLVNTVGTGAVTVTGALDLSASLTGSKILHITSGDVITGLGNLITATELAFNAAGAVGLTTAVSNLAGVTTAGGLTVSNTKAGGLTVTTVDGVVGLDSTNTALSLTETAGNLTVLQAVNAGVSTATITLNTLDKLLTNGAAAITGTAGVTLTADKMALVGGAVDAGAAIATLTQKTNGQLINLGAADANGTLGLTDGELDTVTAGILRIGNTNSGAMTISAAINPALAATLHLTGAGVTGNTFTITDTSLALTATGTGNIDVGTAVNNLAAFSNNGTITVSNTTACCLTITTVDTVAGIDASTGNKAVSLTETLGIVTLSNAVTAGTGTVGITLNTLDKLLTQNANITGQGITLTADNMTLASTITGQAGLVTLANKTAATAIQAGTGAAADAAGLLSINQAEIDTITTTGGITIGAINNTGGITVVAGGANLKATGNTISGPSTLQTGGGNIAILGDLTEASALTLDTRGGAATAGGVIGNGIIGTGVAGAGTLNVNASTVISLSGASTIGTAHLNNNTSGNISYNSNVGGANVLTVDGVNTGTAAGGRFTVTEAAGDLTVSATNLTTKGGEVALTTQKANGVLTMTGGIDTTTGAQTAGANVFLYGSNNITLNAGSINGGTGGVVTLTAMAGGVNEAGAGVITADKLQVNAATNSSLNNAGNNVNTVAANISTATNKFTYKDADTVDIGAVTAMDAMAVTTATNGITTTGGSVDVKTVGLLTITNDINAGAGNVYLTSGAAITEAGTARIIAAALGMTAAAGTITVNTATNNVATVSALSTLANVQYRDADAVAVANIASSGNYVTNAGGTGITTGGSSVDVKNGAGDLTITNDINAGAGNVYLTSGAAITEAGTAKITAAALGMTAAGAITVNTATNNVATLSVLTTVGNIQYRDADAVEVINIASTGNYVTNAGGTGITTAGGNVDVKGVAAGDLTITNGINAGAGNVYLTSGSTITEAGTASIAAAALGMTAAGNITVNTATNNVATVSALTTSGNIQYRDTDAVEVINIASNGNYVTNAGGAGIATAGGSVDMKTGGLLTITNDINAGAGNVYLTSGAAITEAGTAKIIAGALGMTAAGAITVNTATNNVATLSALTTSGNIQYQDLNAVAIANIASSGNYVTNAGGTGITTAGGSVDVKTGGLLTVTNDINAGAGNVYLTSGAAITEAGTAKIIAAALGMTAAGAITVNTATNNVAKLSALTTVGNIQYRDADAVEVINIASNGNYVTNAGGTGITTAGGNVDVKGVAAGDLTITNDINAGAGNVYLTSGSTITEAGTAKIIAAALGMTAAGNITVNTATNNVAKLSALTTVGNIQYRDADAVEVINIASTGNYVTNAGGTGITTAGGNVDVKGVAAGDLTITNDINAGAGNVYLTSGAAITEAGTAKIIAAALGMTAAGAITVNTATNNVTTLSALTTVGNIQYRDADTVEVINIASTGSYVTNAGGTGITTAGGSVDVKTGGLLTLTNDINAGAGNVYLTSAAITEAGTASIIAAALGMTAAGAITVNTATNNVATLSALTTVGNIQYRDADAVEVANIASSGNYATNAGGTGITTAGGSVDVKNGAGLLTLTNGINAGAGNVYLTSGAAITEAGTAKIIAAALGMTAAGAITVNTATNNVATLSALTTVGNIQYQDADALAVANIASSGNYATNAAGVGISTTGAGTLTIIAGGNITQTASVTVGGDASFTANGGSILLNLLNGGPPATPWLNTVNTLGGNISASALGSNISIAADIISLGANDITAATVTLTAPSGAAISTGGVGLIRASQTLGNGNLDALTLNIPGAITLQVNTTGIVRLNPNLVGNGVVALTGAVGVTPANPNKGNNNLRSLTYNGQDANSAAISSALDSAYLGTREATTEIRESGFAKENPAKILRRGVIVDAGPGQAAIDDNQGMQSVGNCEASSKDGAMGCI